MSPEYLNQLADLADPDQLWRRGGLDARDAMSEEQRRQLDAGVALRRYAAHITQLRKALAEKKSLLITPLSLSGTAGGIVETPPNHQRLRDARNRAIPSSPELIVPMERAEDAALRKMGLKPRSLGGSHEHT